MLKTRAVPIEQIVSLDPFIVRRRIAFRDCDPAGIVYTPRILDPIAISAIELFIAELIGPYGDRDKSIDGLDLPAKAVSMVFHSPLRYGDLADLSVYCSRIGNTTFDLTVDARSTCGEALFDCTTTMICIGKAARRSILVPDYVQNKLQPYIRDLQNL